MASSLSNVRIKNGSLSNFTQAGIEISSNVTNPTISGVNFVNNARGVYYNGSSGQPITQSMLSDVEFVQSGTAIESNYLTFSTIKNIVALQSLSAGFDIKNSSTNLISQITIDGVNGVGTAYGINLQGGATNTVQDGLIKAVSSSATDTHYNAYGIRIANDEYNDDIQKMKVLNVSGPQPYGIAMDPVTDVALSNTGIPSTSLTNAGVRVSWSRDGRYIAVASTAASAVYVFQYGGSVLTYITSISSITANDVSWSSDASYLLTTNTTFAQVYSFNGASLTLLTSQDHTATVYAVAWSYDNRYVALGGDPSGGNSMRLYQFNGSALAPLLGINVGGDSIRRIKFAHNSYTLAACGFTGITDHLYVYSFDAAASTATLLATATGAASTFQWNDLDWSYDDRYIAQAQGSEGTVTVFTFTGSSLTALANYNYVSIVRSVAWSPTGYNLVIGGDNGNSAQYLRFDGTHPLTLVNSLATGNVYGIAWSPTGLKLVMTTSTNTAFFTQGYDFPSGHNILDCTVAGIRSDSANGFSSIASSNGVGMQVSTEGNVAMNNTVNLSDVPYITTALERYQEFILNIATRNQFPNKISNLSFPPLV